MKIRNLLATACVLLGGQAAAQNIPPYFNDPCYSDTCAYCFGFDSSLSYQVGGGYRRDQISWEAYDLEGPGTVTKEKWNNMGMGVVEAQVEFVACQHYVFEVDFDYAWYDTRKNQSVRTYDIDSHQLLAHTKGHSKGQLYDLSGGIGYQFNFDCFRLSLTPMVGWSYSHQFIKARKFQNELDPEDKVFGKSNYKYRWNGPWIGFAAGYNICCEWLVYLDYRFHWADYRGKVLENFWDIDEENEEELECLYDDCEHIHEETHPNQKASNAYGNEVIVGTSYDFCDRWYLDICFDYKGFWANKGHFTLDDVHHRIKDVNWTSYRITMDVGYTF